MKPCFLAVSYIRVFSQAPPNAPLRLFETDTLLLVLLNLLPNNIATSPIKKPVVTAYIKTSSAMNGSLFVNYYVFFVIIFCTMILSQNANEMLIQNPYLLQLLQCWTFVCTSRSHLLYTQQSH